MYVWGWFLGMGVWGGIPLGGDFHRPGPYIQYNIVYWCLAELSQCMILSVIVIVIVYFSYNTNTIILPKYSCIRW